MDSMDELRSPSLPPTSPAVPIIVFPLPSMLPVLQLLETIRCPEKPRAAQAYVLICALRRIGLAHTQFAQATCGTIRLKLLKIGALVRRSVRRVTVAMASAFPHQSEFALAHVRLVTERR